VNADLGIRRQFREPFTITSTTPHGLLAGQVSRFPKVPVRFNAAQCTFTIRGVPTPTTQLRT
jgi:hypothetical protein